jgi:hypothetical protein
MIPTNIREMEPHIRQRYNFALSSFVRVYGILAGNNPYYKQFCLEWSQRTVEAPLRGLNEVDQYFYFEYKNWRGV